MHTSDVFESRKSPKTIMMELNSLSQILLYVLSQCWSRQIFYIPFHNRTGQFGRSVDWSLKLSGYMLLLLPYGEIPHILPQVLPFTSWQQKLFETSIVANSLQQRRVCNCTIITFLIIQSRISSSNFICCCNIQIYSVYRRAAASV